MQPSCFIIAVLLSGFLTKASFLLTMLQLLSKKFHFILHTLATLFRHLHSSHLTYLTSFSSKAARPRFSLLYSESAVWGLAECSRREIPLRKIFYTWQNQRCKALERTLPFRNNEKIIEGSTLLAVQGSERPRAHRSTTPGKIRLWRPQERIGPLSFTYINRVVFN